MNAIVKHDTLAMDIVEKVVIGVDLSKLSPAERLSYYNATCQSLGLNPLTKPFSYINLNGKLTLYASKDCTEQLRQIHGVSISKIEREVMDGVYAVTAYATRVDGRTDCSMGAVSIENLKGEAKANALMKAETKAKRRVTLSICSLGMLDESEIESIPNSKPIPHDIVDTVVVTTTPSEKIDSSPIISPANGIPEEKSTTDTEMEADITSAYLLLLELLADEVIQEKTREYYKNKARKEWQTNSKEVLDDIKKHITKVDNKIKELKNA